MKKLFDSNHVEICIVAEAQKEFPDLEWSAANRFMWTINNVMVMAVDDLNVFIALKENNEEFSAIKYCDVEICSVCRKVLFIDDECYEDLDSTDQCCNEHSWFDESVDSYRKKIF